jgi:hypothetical protein
MRANTHTGPELCHAARGLCWGCHDRAERDGRLDDFTRRRRKPEEIRTEWELLRSAGCSKTQAAARIGITADGLRKALRRIEGKVA